MSFKDEYICTECKAVFKSRTEVLAHLKISKHSTRGLFKIPSKEVDELIKMSLKDVK